jgi:CysZ protein
VHRRWSLGVTSHFQDVAQLSLGARFWTGVRFAASGVPTTLRSPKLLGLAMIPVLIHTAIYIGLVLLSLRWYDDVVAWSTSIGPEWIRGVVHAAAAVLFIAAMLVIGLLVTIVVGSIVCDPFYDLLSERAEEELLGKSFGAPFTWRGVIPGVLREAGASIVRLSIYVPVALCIWALGFVPIVGQVLGAPLALCWTWLFVCYEVLVRNLSRHGQPIGQRLQTLFSHKALALGFGAGAWVCLFLPFFAPFIVVGGTRMFLALAGHGRVPNRLDDAAKRVLVGGG